MRPVSRCPVPLFTLLPRYRSGVVRFARRTVAVGLLIGIGTCGGDTPTEPTGTSGPSDSPTPVATTIASLPVGVTTVTYSETLTATGGDGSYSWTVIGGALPSGLSLTSSGVITGTPDTSGNSVFTVRVTSGDGQTADQQLTMTVEPLLVITTTAFDDWVVGSSTLSLPPGLDAVGGDGQYAWVAVAGTLPSGMNLGNFGDVHGQPTAAGTFSFTARVSSGSQTAERQFSITIWPAVSIVDGVPKTGIRGEAYADTLVAAGGDGMYTWSEYIVFLPAAFSLDPATGVINGLPTTNGTVNVGFRVESVATWATIVTSFVVIDRPLVTSTVLPSGSVSASYSSFLTMSGGDIFDSNNLWSVVSGPLPPGLSLTASGEVTGTPTAAGTWTFSVQVADFGVTAEGDITITVN